MNEDKFNVITTIATISLALTILNQTFHTVQINSV